MATNDERLFYKRFPIADFETLLVPQAFLDARPLVKTEASEDSPAVLYDESDALTYEDFMRLYSPSSVSLMDEWEEGAPVNLGVLTESDLMDEDATHVFFALTSPKISPKELMALSLQINDIELSINEVLVPYGVVKNNYLATGQLPG
jgi:hypothetical protein